MSGDAGKSATTMSPARFPGRAPIDAYGNGGFRFAGMSHQGSILALPDGIEAWRPDSAADIQPVDLDRILETHATIDVVIIGTGPDILRLDASLVENFHRVELYPEFMSTGAAVRTFNVLLSEDRAVAAALIAVD